METADTYYPAGNYAYDRYIVHFTPGQYYERRF